MLAWSPWIGPQWTLIAWTLFAVGIVVMFTVCRIQHVSKHVFTFSCVLELFRKIVSRSKRKL